MSWGHAAEVSQSPAWCVCRTRTVCKQKLARQRFKVKLLQDETNPRSLKGQGQSEFGGLLAVTGKAKEGHKENVIIWKQVGGASPAAPSPSPEQHVGQTGSVRGTGSLHQLLGNPVLLGGRVL